MSFEIGDIVGGYKIVGLVGAGGVGQVFRVEHSITGRTEAMKVLAGRGMSGQGEAQRFLREVQVQAKLNHPNIAAVHNAFWADDHLVMIMELVDGDSLRDLLEKGPVPLPAALDYTHQALSALSYSHARGVVHRDIKPANLIVTPGGTVKLTDFGLAKTVADPQLTESGAVIGSLYYTSPEQVKGVPTLDARTDLYSLGVVLYEAVTGRRPFDETQAYLLMVAHVTQAPPPPSEINPALPAPLSEIILTVLQKEPARRFQTADEFLEAVERVQWELAGVKTELAATKTKKERDTGQRVGDAGKPAAAAFKTAQKTQPSTEGRSMETARIGAAADSPSPTRSLARLNLRTLERTLRSRSAVIGLVAAVIVVALFTGLMLRSSSAGPSSPEVTQTAGARRPSQPAGAGTQSADTPVDERTHITDPGASQKQAPAPKIAGNAPSPEPSEQPLAGPGELNPSSIETHTKEQDATQQANDTARESSNQYERVRLLRLGQDVWAVGFSPDGRLLAAGTGQNGVTVWEAATGREIATLSGHTGRVVGIGFSPDGRSLATASWDGTAKLWDLSARRERASFGHKHQVSSVTFSPDGRQLASGSNDNTIKVWTLDGAGDPLEFRGQKRGAQALAFSPNGRFLASVSAEKTVRLWSVVNERDPYQLPGPDFGATAVAFSPDGRLLAVAGGNRLKVWDAATKREVQSMDAPGWLHALASAPNGSFLALSATPESVKLWDVASASELSTITRDQTVRSIALSPGGRRLATAADGGKIEVWQARP